jgi:type VI secretion system secreted protein Hcp
MAIYMKFGDVVGDATQYVNKDNSGVENIVFAGLRAFVGDATAAKVLGEAGWISLKSFEWHVQRSITTRAGKGSQHRGPIAADIHDITVDKDIDGSSCDLLRIFNEDKDGVDCTIVYVRTGDPGEVYLQYKLKNTLIKQIHTSSKGDRPNEQLILNFTEIEFAVWRANQDNVAPGASRYRIEKQATQQGGGPSGRGGEHGHSRHQ